MQNFTPLEYLLIDIANHYGLDKSQWSKRLNWATTNLDKLGYFNRYAESPILYRKAVRALDEHLKGNPISHLVSLDSTASGIQIMSAMAGCESGCRLTNLITTGKRVDLYQEVSDSMSQISGEVVEREVIKHPIMTTFYGSTAQPKSIFGEGDLYNKYLETLEEELPGAMAMMKIMQDSWDPNALAYSWTLPDGHTAGFKVMVPKEKKIEVDELDHATFTHTAYVNEPVDKGLSLAANIVHSIDGYIVREMYRACDFELLTIHDSFWCHPNDVDMMRQTYNNIFAQKINIDLFNSIMSEVSETKHTWEPYDRSLNAYFADAEYALS